MDKLSGRRRIRTERSLKLKTADVKRGYLKSAQMVRVEAEGEE